ncbi:MAG: ABC transporter permease, partial [Vicinamibacterales bacterium]
MNVLRRLSLWIRWRRFDADMREELEFHRAEIQRALEAKGVRPGDAARQSRRQIGNVTLAREEARDVWIWRWLDSTWQDVAYAFRGMRKAPGFTLTAVLTLALGIGGTTAIFSLVETIFLRPLPVDHPEQLVLFSRNLLVGSECCEIPAGDWRAFSSRNVEMFRAAHLPFEDVAAFSGSYDDVSIRLATGSAPGAGQTDLVSGNFFDVMRVRPLLGRALTASDDRPGAAPVVVVGEHFWRTRLNASPTVIGEDLIVNRLPVTIVGVMPASFFGVRLRRPDLWTPLEWQPQIQQRDPVADQVQYLWLQVVGRLRPGAARSSADVAATTALHRFLLEESG